LGETCLKAGFALRERLAVYDEYIDRPGFLNATLREMAAARQAELAQGAL